MTRIPRIILPLPRLDRAPIYKIPTISMDRAPDLETHVGWVLQVISALRPLFRGLCGAVIYLLYRLCGALVYLCSCLFSLLYWLASPLVYLLHGLLALALLPLQLLVKFEVDCLFLGRFRVI